MPCLRHSSICRRANNNNTPNRVQAFSVSFIFLPSLYFFMLTWKITSLGGVSNAGWETQAKRGGTSSHLAPSLGLTKSSWTVHTFYFLYYVFERKSLTLELNFIWMLSYTGTGTGTPKRGGEMSDQKTARVGESQWGRQQLRSQLSQLKSRARLRSSERKQT